MSVLESEWNDVTVVVARDEDRVAAIAHITGLSEATVRRRLEAAHGKMLVRNLFGDRWPSDGASTIVT